MKQSKDTNHTKYQHGAMLGLLFAIFLVGLLLFIFRDTESDKIKDQIVNAAIASYGGRCICPFNKTAQGDSCNNRSLYNKAQRMDARPICYRTDVSEVMVESFKSADLSYAR
jgi:hypothetical protein